MLGLILRIVGGLLGVIVGIGGVGYAIDYGIGATVIERKCAGGGILGGSPSGEATVRVKLVPTMTHTVTELPVPVCNALHEGNFVVYHVRTGRTVLFDSDGGACIYDSQTGRACT